MLSQEVRYTFGWLKTPFFMEFGIRVTFCMLSPDMERIQFGETRANQNTGGALLEFPMRTAMHGKSRVSSAISFCHN